jgi:hypothetical protein
MRDPFTKQVLQDIASFNNRYLGGILANHVFLNPENWNAGNAENCDAVYNYTGSKNVSG